MIDEEKTFREKGYYSTDLKPKSGKEVWRVCNECGKGKWVKKCDYRDLCHKCANRTEDHCRRLSKSKKGKKIKLQKCETHTEKLSWIDDDITYAEKGYRSTDLKPKSSKEVWCICKDCKEGRWIKFKDNRDLCLSCARKKGWVQSCRTYTEKLDYIDDDITYAEKGYKSTDLKPDSHKEVWRVCDECGEGRWLEFRYCVRLCSKCAIISENTSSWKGGVSFEPYCKKFNKAFKEAVRERFGWLCFMCLVTEENNGKRLCVHHVSYDKDCMCSGVDCEFVPLCKRCHSKTNGDRDLWERLIINVLCYEGWI